MLLDRSTRTLQLNMGEVTSTIEMQIVVHYEDNLQERIVNVSQLSLSNGVANVVICNAPPDNCARKIKEITIYNADNVTHNISVILFEDANPFALVHFVLLTGKTYMYTNDKGWFAV